MANKAFTQLPAVLTANLADIIAVVQGDITSQETLQQVLDLFRDNLNLNYAGDPNGNVAGTEYQFLIDTMTNDLYVATTTGSATTAVWTLIGNTATILAELASNAAGKGASLIGLEDQGTVSGKTAQDLSELDFVTVTDPTATAVNGVPLSSLALLLAGGTMAGNISMDSTYKVTNAIDPTSAQDYATKAYVDAVATGLNIQAACVCASTTALTVTYDNGTAGVGATLTNAAAMAAFTVDGVSPTVGQRVLIKDQAATLQNGIYTVTTVGSGAANWVLTRARDFDTPTEIQPGDWVAIISGTTQSGSSWLQTDTVTAVGTDPIEFIQFSASIPVAVINGGTGLTALTAYNLIIGNGTSAATLLAPSATSGVPLISQGAASDPAYGTAVIAGGGTGATTAAAAIGNLVSGTALSTATVATDDKVLIQDTNDSDNLKTVTAQSIADLAGAASAASQAEMEAASSTSVYSSPGRQQYHPSAAKAWFQITLSGGTPTLTTNYNVSGIVDNAAGDFTITWDTDFSSANYAMAFGTYENGFQTGDFACIRDGSPPMAAQIRISCLSNANTLADPAAVYGVAFGDQ